LDQLKQKIEELRNSGKIRQLEIYVEILNICFKNKSKDLFKYFDQFLHSWKEYLQYDKNPKPALDKKFLEALTVLFKFIQKTNDTKSFHKYFPIYEEFNKHINESVAKAKLYQSFGYIFWLIQDIPKSKKYLQQSLELINDTDNNFAIPSRYTNLGYIYEFSGDYDKAEKYYNRGLNYAKQYSYKAALRLAYAALGRLYYSRGNYTPAIKFFRENLTLSDKDNHNINRLTTMTNLANSYNKMEKYGIALQYFKKLKTEWLKKENPELYNSNLVNMALTHINLKNYKKAADNLQTALKFAQEKGVGEIQFACYLNLANIYQKKNNLNKAVEFYKKSIKIAEKTNIKKQKNAAYLHIANFYKKNNLPQKAIPYFNKSLKISRGGNNPKKICTIFQSLSECYEKSGKFKKAYEFLKLYEETRKKLEREDKVEEDDLDKSTTVSAGRSKQYMFKEGISLISWEMSNRIGAQLIGKSSAMQKVIQQAFLASNNSESSVLILGESGTGKEIIAKLIHYASDRHKGPFISVNSAALSSSLAQSSLFGHKKGAFTGASSDHKGYFEAADNGTIFLDEISEMPLDIQAQLLRVLEEKKIKHLGSHKKRKIDFRLISATNRNIYQLVENDNFRFDLINRIDTLKIKIPPLRKRKEDIPLLIEFYLDIITRRLKKSSPKISSKAIDLLCEYDYPGNVRQLINILEKLILFCNNDRIEKSDIYFWDAAKNTETGSKKFETLNLKANERELIMQALQQTNNVQVEAAKLLGISPSALSRRLKKMDIEV